MNVQVRPEVYINTNEFLGSISQLGISEIERFLSDVSMILARRKASSLSTKESILLKQIGQGVPHSIQNRYDVLQKKVLAENITAEEHQELLGMIDTVERADADRLKSLIELSQLRQVSLDQVMSQLGIHQPSVYV